MIRYLQISVLIRHTPYLKIMNGHKVEATNSKKDDIRHVVYSSQKNDLAMLEEKFEKLNRRHEMNMIITMYNDFEVFCNGCGTKQKWKWEPKTCEDCGGKEFATIERE